MKNIIKSACLLLLSACAFTACEDDNFYNPTVQQPSSFVLNTPAYSSSNLDLATSETVNFTWSQPNYGFPVAAQYQVQVSLDGNFTTSVAQEEADESGATTSNYFEIENIFNSCSAAVDAAAIAKGLQQIAKWDEGKVPTTQTIYARVKSTLNGLQDVFSNVVTLNVIPYYVELTDAAPERWYLVGACIGDGSWNNSPDGIGTGLIPMYTKAGEEYDKKTGKGVIQYIGYLTSAGFKLIKNPGSWDDQWGQGDSFGTFVMNDGGSGNITVPEAGIYTVSLNTATDELKIEKYGEAVPVFDGMAIAGSFNEWGDTPMTPCSTGWENHDWYISTSLSAGDEIKIKQAGSWDYNRGGSFITTNNGMYVYGVANGDNLVITESGNYLILFNDITGYIRFIKQ